MYSAQDTTARDKTMMESAVTWDTENTDSFHSGECLQQHKHDAFSWSLKQSQSMPCACVALLVKTMLLKG